MDSFFFFLWLCSTYVSCSILQGLASNGKAKLSIEAHLEICLFYSQSKENEWQKNLSIEKSKHIVPFTRNDSKTKKLDNSLCWKHFIVKIPANRFTTPSFIITPKNYVNMTFHFFLLSFFFLCFIVFIRHEIFRDILFPHANYDNWHNQCMFSIDRLQLAVLNYLSVNQMGFDDFGIETVFKNLTNGKLHLIFRNERFDNSILFRCPE